MLKIFAFANVLRESREEADWNIKNLSCIVDALTKFETHIYILDPGRLTVQTFVPCGNRTSDR